MFIPEFVKKYTNNLLYSNVWNSHLFLRNNLPCKKNSFRSLHGKITYPVDLLKNEGNVQRLIAYEECLEKYGNIVHEEFISLKLLITQGMRKVDLDLSKTEIVFPFLPVNLQVINLNKKGCIKWTNILKEKKNCNNLLVIKERNWELSLGHIQGVPFWDKCYGNVKNIYFDNVLKLFYYNIIRGTLKTNRIVNHFVEELTPACTFCLSEVETIKHLFWECRLVETFIEVTINNIGNEYPVFSGLVCITSKKIHVDCKMQKSATRVYCISEMGQKREKGCYGDDM